jgi:hypothetical protein
LAGGEPKRDGLLLSRAALYPHPRSTTLTCGPPLHAHE